MGYKKILGILIGLAIFGLISGFFLSDPFSLGLCESGDYSCDAKIGEGVGMPMILFSFFLFLISLLLFIRQEVFHSWKKFAIVYLPVAAILLFIAAGESGGGIGFARIDGEIISWFLSGIFLFISLLIICIKSWKLRKGDQKV